MGKGECDIYLSDKKIQFKMMKSLLVVKIKWEFFLKNRGKFGKKLIGTRIILKLQNKPILKIIIVTINEFF